MGVYIYFKGKMITNYRHVPCAFGKMQKARVESNVIKSPNEIDGLEKLSAVDQQIIINRIQEDKEKRSAPLARSYQKIIVPRNVLSPIERRKKLKMMKTPSIKVLFTNADQFTHSKKNELQERIITDKPIIIAVSEVKPKNSKDMTEADYKIEGYTLNTVNIETNPSTGRGIIIYTHNSLDKSTIQIKMNNQFKEACLLEIRLRGGDILLFGCFYRSPTPTSDSIENNENLNRLLKTICTKSYSHICLVGDLNYKDINWKSWTTSHGDESKEVKFIEAIRDCYLFQHIDKPTRVRGNDDPSLIDFLLTNEEHQVSDVVHHAPLGKSDHSVITFNYHCYLDFSKPRKYYNYHKGDFTGMVNILESTNRKDTFILDSKDKDPENIWSSLRSKLIDLRNEFIPTITPKIAINFNNKASR